MPKSKWNLNTIYISERLQESLRPISRCAMTTVVAPMGYGKTTAVEWYLAERARAEAPYIVRISVYSSNLVIFWKSVQDAFARAGFAFLREYDCPTDGASGGLLIDDLCHALTVVMADAHAEDLLAALTGQNAFVKRLPDGATYRFHHMMKECALHTFLSMPKERQTVYRGRLGIWYEDHRLYLHAMTEYRQNGDYDAMLRTLQKDAGILLSSLHPKAVLAALDECPAAVLASHPLAILVLMRSMFNWRNIPKMLELKELLLTAISENTALSAQEKGDLRGSGNMRLSG